MAQVTLSVLLLVGAGLFLRSLSNLRHLGPGFPADHLIGFNVDPALNGYDANRSKAFYLRLTGELAALPGVQSAGPGSRRIRENKKGERGGTLRSNTPGNNPRGPP